MPDIHPTCSQWPRLRIKYRARARLSRERVNLENEFVRRVLGHKNLETPIRFYVGLETVEAVRKFSAMALESIDPRPAP